MRILLWIGSLTLLSSGAATAQELSEETPDARRRPLTAEDLLAVRYVTEPAVSPDGESIAYVMVEPPDVSNPRGLATKVVSRRLTALGAVR